ncbi:MAG: HU family DNA-binding protein [Planctomycetia bacterium]|nr:HU family DNA-binding protein [Planctomycetia bacterium]
MAKKAAAPVVPVVVKPLTKSEILANVAQATGLSKKDVSLVLDALAQEIRKSVAAKAPGTFIWPGLFKVEKKSVPAKKAKKGVKNPFTGEVKDIPAKPASSKIKIRPLKGLKDAVDAK